VIRVRRGSTVQRAGLRAGDVVRWWRRELPGAYFPDRGALSSVFAWGELLLEQVPRGTVRLRGTRRGLARSWTLPAGAPVPLAETGIRPVLPAAERRADREARRLAPGGDIDGAVALRLAVEKNLRSNGDRSLAAWFALEAARLLVAAERGDEADPLYRRLVAGYASSPPGYPAAAQLLREQADDLRDRELWNGAEAADRRALALDRALSPRKLAAARSLAGLAYTASGSAGTLDPEPFLQQAMALRRRWAPGSSEIADSWWDFGKNAAGQDDFSRAKGFYRHAVAAMERAAPRSLYLAEKLTSLGKAQYFTGDLEGAARSWQRALEIAQQLAPEDRWTAGLLQGFGDLELRRGDWRRAAELLERSLALCERLAIPPFAQTDVLSDLARAERELGRKAAGAAHACRAMEIFEGRRERAAANPETQLRWGEEFADYYRNCARARVDTGEPAVAFDVLERGRARTFLNLVAEGPRRPTELRGRRAAEWRSLDAEYDRIQAELAELRRREAAGARAPLREEGRLREIERRKREILTDGTAARPRYPPPLDLAGAAGTLDPGTLLLSFATAEDQTLLFAVQGGPGRRPAQAVFVLPAGYAEIGRKIEAFRRTVVEDRFHLDELKRQGTALYDLLLRPADSLIAASKRLVIVPDGPLHTLPFAALVRDGRFLAEDRPLHFATSATAYAELTKRRRAGGEAAALELLAFGDPSPGPAGSGAWAPLPAARREIGGIARLFPRSRVWLGPAATEERVKREAGRAALLHFAVHARIDPRLPSSSALVMSTPRRGEAGNGLLQAWEIIEDLHLDADLVTLSACDTALGANMGGEGLIGLTRAFQSAGARSVLATLWEISDAPSAALMQRFYAALRAGRSKDEALREAQVAQLRRAQGGEPFYWAAYQLYGDWR
jgi:CHAT domain-containing protein/tetratricopeptide (TPR) repeat protein